MHPPNTSPVNLHRLADEELVGLARHSSCPAAVAVLLRRYDAWMRQVVGYLGRRTRLAAEDVEDAQQRTWFALGEAVFHFDLGQQDRDNVCSFRTFLHRVLVARFRDYFRHLRRLKVRDRRLHVACELLAPRAGAARRGGPVTSGTTSAADPARAAERQEYLSGLERALDGLDRVSRRLCEQVMFGLRLHEVARESDLSYDKAKRRRRQVLAQLRDRLRAFAG